MINLRQFLQVLRQKGEVVDIEHEVDPHLEIAEIHRRVIAEGGPALFFRHVKGSPFPVVTNLFGTRSRVQLAFQNRPDQLIASLVKFATEEMPPTLPTLWKKRKLLKNLLHMGMRHVGKVPVKECHLSPPRLDQIPLIKSWPEDGGDFITLPLVYTEPPQGGAPNLGMYRIQRYDQTTTGLHFQIQKGGGFHYFQAEQENLPLPVNIFIGGPPALMLSAITPLPENVSELLLCGLLQGERLAKGDSPYNSYPLVAECEFALVGKALPHVRRLEGPFGDHYGYYSLAHEFPVFECEAMYHRKDAIYPATVVGKPKQEDFFIGDYLQELLSPLFPVVMPSVRDLWSYGETGFHSLSSAIVKERYERESMVSAFRILGEGQLSLTKFLLLTDQLINLRDFKQVLRTILERFQPEKDLFIFSPLSMDTLDYTGPSLNKGSRGVMLGIGEKIRDLPCAFQGAPPPSIETIGIYCPGCLLMQGKNVDLTSLLSHQNLSSWPLVILVDDIQETLKDETTFLWTVFTRFEPAADMHALSSIYKNHIVYKGPILIDARMKASYPPIVACDSDTEKLVSKNWNRYFAR